MLDGGEGVHEGCTLPLIAGGLKKTPGVIFGIAFDIFMADDK